MPIGSKKQTTANRFENIWFVINWLRIRRGLLELHWRDVLNHLGWPWGYLEAASGSCMSLPPMLLRCWAPLVHARGPSWGAPGALLDVFGALLELFWAPLGAIPSDLVAILRPQTPIGNENATIPKSLKENSVFD